MAIPKDAELLRRLWAELGGPERALASVVLHGPGPILPSVFEVDALATASVALATLSASEFLAARSGESPRAVAVDRRHAAVAFRSERYLEAVGWDLPPGWDPIAGDYETRDGWIRLHTNYRTHRDAALRVLRAPESRDAVAKAVLSWTAEELETAVVRGGGCAAVMRTAAEYADHPLGRATEREPLFAWTARPAARPALDAGRGRPLGGVRVLDLTRVIAGPVCTRFLSAYGADVLRIDPPGFEEVERLLGDTTGGKRRAALDLRAEGDRRVFEALVADAHVLVVGYRGDALDRLGFDAAWRARKNRGLVTVALNAYGWAGPWASRRGFDSLVQMTTGIAARGRKGTGSTPPIPLPAQALDHATGYLAAAAACVGLTRRVACGLGSDVRLSLARTARLLWDLGTEGDPGAPDLRPSDFGPYMEAASTPRGPLRRVRCPGTIEGLAAEWSVPPGLLGIDEARW